MNKLMIEQIAEIAHGTVRSLGVATGTVDLPTWQILPVLEKSGYREAVAYAMSEGCALASDPITERLARQTYEHEVRITQLNRISKGIAEDSEPAAIGWNGLSEQSRMQWRLVVAVTRVFAMSHTAAVPMAGAMAA